MNGATACWGRKTHKYGLVLRTSLQNNLAYAGGFVFDSLFYAFVVLIFIQLWRQIYRQGVPLAGYRLEQMIWYLIVTEMMTLSRSNVFEELNQEIKSGNIAYLLTKPFDYLLYQAANGLGLVGWKWGINALMGLALGLIFVGPLPGFQAAVLPWVLLAMAAALTLNFLAMACLGLSAFWLEENSAFYWIYQKLIFILGMLLPIELLPVWAQRIAVWLPFPYISYGPAKLAVDFSPERLVAILEAQAGYILVLAALAWFIFRKGVARINVNGG